MPLTAVLRTIALCACFLFCASAKSAEPSREISAFVDVTVIRVYGEPHLRNQTVIVRGDRIIRVAPMGSVRLPPGAHVLNRPGQILAPGLADMHVHIFTSADARLFVANGVTTVRNMRGRAETDLLASRIEAGLEPGPRIYSSGPIINGPTSSNFANTVAAPADIRALIARDARAGYVGAKLYENLSPNVFRAGVRAARERGLQVYAHVPTSMSLEKVLDLRIDSIEHLTGFDRALAPDDPSDWDEERWSHADRTQIAPLARRVARSGVWNDATLVLFQTTCAFADMAAAESRPEYRYATPRQRAVWRSHFEEARRQRDPSAACEMSKRAHAQRLEMLRALRAEQAPILIGTDAPQPYVYSGISLHDELAHHVNAGFSRAEVLRIASHEAARFLRQQKEFGVVAPGARADLLLLDHDPEKDLTTLRSPAGVMAAGRWRDAATLSRLFEDVAGENTAAP